jgi:hypothetical protein
MSGSIEDQYIVSTKHPVPPDAVAIRKYKWYERFCALNQELYEGGIVSGLARAKIIIGVEKMMVAAATASIFGHDVHRERAAAFLAAELRAADPDCPIPGQIRIPDPVTRHRKPKTPENVEPGFPKHD